MFAAIIKMLRNVVDIFLRSTEISTQEKQGDVRRCFKKRFKKYTSFTKYHDYVLL